MVFGKKKSKSPSNSQKSDASGSKSSLLGKIAETLSGTKSKAKSKLKSLRKKESKKDKNEERSGDTETDVDPSDAEHSSRAPSPSSKSSKDSTQHSDSSIASDESTRPNGRKPKKNKRTRDFENTDKSGVYHIMIRVIEGRDLAGVNLRVKASVDGQSESTRVSSEKDPRWRQNLSFTMNRSMEKVSDTVLELKLFAENRIARDKLHGEWTCFLGSILHQPDRAIISKWVALRRPKDEVGNESENVGFLRVSIAIYGNTETPPPMADNEGDELFSGAQLLQFTLMLRLFRLHAITLKLREPWKSKKKTPYFSIRVTVGDASAESDIQSIDYVKGEYIVALDQEITLPIMWPTVINSIQFALILSKGKKPRRIVARSSILLSSIYVAGDEGFLPTFGPSFVNFYGPQTIPRLKLRRQKHPSKDFDEHRFYCRLLVSVECFDTPSDEPTVGTISRDSDVYAKQFEQSYKYALCCSFFDCSSIDPQFASSTISFLVSIGHYGSSDADDVVESSSTLPITPYPDGAKYFSLPWGNYKPVTYVDCLFDKSAFRIERINAIMKVVTLLDHYIDEARVNCDQSPEDVASITVDAIENTVKMLDVLLIHHREDELSTKLDFDRYDARREMIKEMRREMVDLKFSPLTLADTVVDSMRLLSRIREWVRRMAVDDSASLPDVFVKMFASGKMIGVARIPCAKVFFSKNDSLRGDLCAKLHAYPIEWLQMNTQKRKAENVAGVVQARLWVGDQNKVKHWLKDLQPAEQKSYLEVYQYQKKLPLADFKDDNLRSLNGRDMANYVKDAPEGWKYKGSWFVMNSHSMWIRGEEKKQSVIDKLFELEWKPGGDPNTGWAFKSYTDYYGKELPKNIVNKPPPDGWELVGEGKYVVDRSFYGNKEGWLYSITSCFWGDAEMTERKQGTMHIYRRRCLERMRRSKKYDEKEEDLDEFIKALRPEEQWEYASSEKKPFHDDPDSGDSVRRRRCLIEIVNDKETRRTETTSTIARFYEAHSTFAMWQMRAYIMWGKELFPSPHMKVFVRVTFMATCKETHVVEQSQHPIWNETIIFDNQMIPGSQNELKQYPPTVLVEVKGERQDDREVFLGRFYAKPVVILDKSDRRGTLSWHTLHFRQQRTRHGNFTWRFRGSLLVLFELFLKPNPSKGVAAVHAFIPDLPEVKSHLKGKQKRYEVPNGIRPTFERYSVQALFWGVRNIAKYQLLTVRRPIVEIVVGDTDAMTDPLTDVNKNPNFDEPFITFDSVRLPTLLHLAPPLVLNLYDSRAFKRTPLVGTCSISDIKRYIHIISKSEARAVHDYSAFDAFVEQQDNVSDAADDRSIHDGDEEWFAHASDAKIDWWSKYYYSLGMPEKAPNFEKSGYDKLRIYESDLESVREFKGFEDFLDTFKFTKSSKGHFDDAEEKEVTGELKGKLFITKHVDGKPCMIEHPPGVEFTGPVECVVRVYMVEAKDLVAARRSGICDPYVVVRLGKQKMKLKKSYRADTTEPQFGEMVEFRAVIPIEKDLTISVMDKRTLMADEEIGSTRIDLENRVLSKFRGTVGIADEFVTKGDLGWRDQISPLKILSIYCKKMLLPSPEIVYEAEKPIGIKVLGITFKEIPDPTRPEICGSSMQRIALLILHKVGLVPEHVETRPLTSLSHGGNVVCGRMRCFVDVFPISLGLIPPPLDISLREPQKYQLRIALFYVVNAILCKRSFGKPSGDLYFKVFVNGMRKPHKTDIHYRVTDGYGSFNWRILIDFDFDPWEKKVYMDEKKRIFKKARRELVDPLVIIQLWDNNKFKKDGFIGEYTLNLLDIEFGKMSEGEQREVSYAKEKKTCWCILGCKFMCKACIKCCCSCASSADSRPGPPKVIPLPRAPRYLRPAARPIVKKKSNGEGAAGDGPSYDCSSSESAVSLFELYATQGVWPLLSRSLQSEQKLDSSARKKKDDDAQDIDYVMGCLEMELQLLPKVEADAEPVGKKRNEPNHSPFLDKPDRSKWDSFWFTSRIKPALSFWWRKCGAQCLMVTICVVFTVLVIAAFIYQLSNFPFKIIGL